MEFEILKTKFDVRWDHLWVYLGALLAIAIPALIVTALWAYAYPADSSKPFQANFSSASNEMNAMIAIVEQPLGAFVTLAVAYGIFKMKKDAGLCRSLTTVAFIIGIGTSVLVFIYWNPIGLFYATVKTLANLLDNACGAVVLYLWLSFFLGPEMGKIRKTAAYATAFAVLSLVITKLIPVFIANADIEWMANNGIVSASALPSLLSGFLFAFAIFYHEMGKKAGVWEYAFVGAYIGTALLVGLATALSGPPMAGLGGILGSVAKLALLYALSRPEVSRIIL